MKVQVIDDDTVRIVLSAAELSENGLSYRALDDRDPHTRAFLIAVLQSTGAQLGRNLLSGEIRIEAYPYADGGCVLFLSQREQPSITTPIAALLPTFDALVSLCRTLYAKYSHTLLQSAAYRTAGCHILLLFSSVRPEKAMRNLIFSAGYAPPESLSLPMLLREYADPILTEDAVPRLALLG